MSILKDLASFLSPKAREAKRRRMNYEFLRSEITRQHQAGIGALRVRFEGMKFDDVDLSSFRPPMYKIAKTETNDPMIIWDGKMMTEEIGFQPTGVINGNEETPTQDNR